MRLVIVQHNRHEHAGRFRAMLARDGVAVRVLLAPETGPQDWPQPDEFDALWVLGGVMQVWETATYPWLTHEIGFIRRAVTDWAKPYLGICFGHQLLAQATGGAVARAGMTEFGVRQVRRHDPDEPLLLGLADRFSAFHWHAAEVTRVPGGLDIAAFNAVCANQAMSGAPAVASVQFHPEVDRPTMTDWLATPGCIDDLVAARGEGAADRLLTALDRAEPDLARLADTLYGNWMKRARAALSGA